MPVDMSSSARIIAENLSVFFPLYHASARSLKKTVLAAASGRLAEDRQHRVVVQALREINLTITGGERVGLIGSNGAGKTTLLRTLAGIYEPIGGRVCVYGALNALLDSQLGMNMELSGRENIMLRGLYKGLSRSELARLEEDVAEFSGLGEFLDLPVRIYSSGMVLRLGFALATAIKPQILLMDEWILAGDANFLDRARARMEAMVHGAEILMLSSHDGEILRTWCSRVIWLDQGRIRADGPADEILEQYFGRPVLAPSPSG